MRLSDRSSSHGRRAGRSALFAGALILALAGVAFAADVSIGNVDGVWGVADTNGATNDAWGTGQGAVLTATSNDSPSIQTPPSTDENQVRYGTPSRAENIFANKSGFGFDGADNPGTVPLDTPFYLGKFTHYNYVITTSRNPMAWVDLTLTAPIDCDGTPIGNLDFVYRFTLEETPNSGRCPYPGATPCSDKVTVASVPANPTFQCGQFGEFTLEILGFVQGASCDQTYVLGSVSNVFITEERQANQACLWAKITQPLAVDLESLSAEAQAGQVVVRWVTNSETSLVGFNVYRGSSSDGPWSQLNTAVIPAAAPGASVSNSYEYADATADPGRQYFYRLEAVNSGGDTESLGTTSVVYGGAVRRWFPDIGR